MTLTPLEKIGIVSTVIIGYFAFRKVTAYIYNNFIGPRSRNVDFKATGQWALVTGSTDGVGKAYAKALAKKGMDIILISRSEEKLKTVANEIEQEFNVKTKIIAVDFTDSIHIYDHIEKQIMGCEIGVLVNNVGMSYPYPEYFLELPERDTLYENIIKTNVVAVTKMCSMIMPSMVERKRGVVINVSSLSALMPSAMLAVYAASKIYVDKLSADLATSYEKKGVIVQSIVPGPVATKMLKAHRATWMAPTADDYVASALATCGKSVCSTGYGPHDILYGITSLITFICPAATTWIITKSTENIRQRALKKMSPRTT